MAGDAGGRVSPNIFVTSKTYFVLELQEPSPGLRKVVDGGGAREEGRELRKVGDRKSVV